MKLVQLLAKELKEWPESATFIVQDENKNVWSLDKGLDISYSVNEWVSEEWFNLVLVDGLEILINCLASDNKTSKVTQDQWKSEREKMNKPKWIRHRGGKCPVADGVDVTYRLRCGYVGTVKSERLMWDHQKDESDLMAYYVEETKDQEIEEVKKTNFGTITYNVEINVAEATKEIDSLVAKWGQIESPLKWRDAIIHCQAIIEDCEREIERNVSLLDAEGLMMQKDSKKAMQHYAPDVDMSDWRNWKRGDIISISNDPDIKDGEYKVTSIEEYDYDGDLPVQVTDGWADFSEATVKFVRRP